MIIYLEWKARRTSIPP